MDKTAITGRTVPPRQSETQGQPVDPLYSSGSWPQLPGRMIIHWKDTQRHGTHHQDVSACRTLISCMRKGGCKSMRPPSPHPSRPPPSSSPRSYPQSETPPLLPPSCSSPAPVLSRTYPELFLFLRSVGYNVRRRCRLVDSGFAGSLWRGGRCLMLGRWRRRMVLSEIIILNTPRNEKW